MLKLPLWIVTEHIHPTSPEHTPESVPAAALVFSTVEKLAAFKAANRGGEWKIEVADDREGLVIVIADLHRLGVNSLILDPPLKGDGGQPISLADLVGFADDLGKPAE